MSIPLVWPEHPEVSGVIGLHDCTQCAALMCLIYAGFTAFPLGIYTVAERNALDASDDRPDNTGATLDGSLASAGWLDKQVSARYDVHMHMLPDDSAATLRAALLKPGYAFLLQGSMGNLPVGHPLRRWEPEFGGGHAVCIITGASPRWLDPLAPLKFAGDLIDVDDALRFAWDGNEYSRYLKQNELATLPDTATEDDSMVYITVTEYATPRLIRCYAQAEARALPDLFPAKADADKYPPEIRAYAPPVHEVVKTLSKASSFSASGHAKVLGWSSDPSEVFEYHVAANGYFGPDSNGGTALLVADTNLTRPEPLPAPSADCSAQEATITQQTGIIADQKTKLAAANASVLTLQGRITKKDAALSTVIAQRKADDALDATLAQARAA